RDRGDGGEAPHPGASLGALRDGQRRGEAGDDGACRPAAELAARDEGEDAEHGDRVGHQAVDETEPHDFTAARGGGFDGALPGGTLACRARRPDSATEGGAPLVSVSTASTSARNRRRRSAPTLRSARTRSPAVVAIVTPSPRFRWATARDA